MSAAEETRQPRIGRLATVTGGEAATPLLILFGLNLVDEFDRIAFAALSPEIRDAFGLTDTGIASVAIVVGVFVLLSALPIGVIGDRFNRVRMTAFAATLWGTMSLLTGLAPALWALFIVRLFAGLGRVMNEVVHPSLLGDYYKSEHHPRVFLVHRMANPLSAVSAIAAGAIGEFFGWRWAFIVLAIPTFILIAALVVKLREPARGESIDRELALRLAGEEPVPFGEAIRQLRAVRTLRRMWIGSFFLGAASLSLAALVALFYENVYDFGPFQRGFVGFVSGAGIFTGLFVGERLATRAMLSGNTSRLAAIVGFSFVQCALGLVLTALSPWAALSVLFTFFLNIGIGAYQPAYFPLVGLVAPPRVRAQAYAYAILFVGAGGLVSLGLFSVGENAGYRLAIVLLSGVLALAGFIGVSASSFVARDIEQAQNAMAVTVALREEMAATGQQALLVCRRVEVAYDQVQVLFGVDLEVRPGEIVALLGTNGAGKSTLLKAISGTVDPIGGAIFFDGRDITHADAGQTARQGIVQVPGGKAVFPTLTVAEHLRAAGWLYRDDPEHLAAARAEVLELFPRLAERIDQMAGNLSGGEQQMLALSMAFIARPKLLMIDELSLGLAPTIVEQLLGIVRKIQEAGTAIILVEQSINVALTVAQRAYFLEKGEVRFEGPTAELLDRNDIVRSVFLEGGSGASPPVPKATARAGAPRDLGERPVVLEVDGLVKRFGGIRAVNDTSFVLREGEILGLIGPNGAGKTTIFDLVSGFVAPDGGTIRLNDIDITSAAPDKRAWLGLGRSFQDARLVPSLTVAENIAIALERHLPIRDPLASMLGFPGVVEQEEDVAWTVSDLIDLMNLGAYRDKFVRELSTGSRRIVDLAMCIAHDPHVLLLDEPSSGIAQRETEALGPMLQRIQGETGCALLVIEHDMPLITAISDRMIALELGRPIAEGAPADVIRDPVVVGSYLGDDTSVIHRSGRGAATKPRARAATRRAAATGNGSSHNGATPKPATKRAAKTTAKTAAATRPAKNGSKR